MNKSLVFVREGGCQWFQGDPRIKIREIKACCLRWLIFKYKYKIKSGMCFRYYEYIVKVIIFAMLELLQCIRNCILESPSIVCSCFFSSFSFLGRSTSNSATPPRRRSWKSMPRRNGGKSLSMAVRSCWLISRTRNWRRFAVLPWKISPVRTPSVFVSPNGPGFIRFRFRFLIISRCLGVYPSVMKLCEAIEGSATMGGKTCVLSIYINRFVADTYLPFLESVVLDKIRLLSRGGRTGSVFRFCFGVR